MANDKCGRCGGWLYTEKLPESSRKRAIWEWTCITCGQTYYPEGKAILEEGGRAREAGGLPESAGKYSRR